MNKQLVWTLVKYGIGLAVLALLVWRYWEPGDGSPGLAAMLHKSKDYGAFALAALICACGLLLTFFRWYVLVRAQELPFTLYNAMRLGLIGYAFSTFLPGSVGGDIIRAACLAREQSRRTVAMATVVIDRIIGLVALIWLVAILGLYFWATNQIVEPAAGNEHGQVGLMAILISAWCVTGASLLFWVGLGLLSTSTSDAIAARLRRLPRLGGPAAEFWKTLWMYRSHGSSVEIAMILALLGHVGFVVAFYFGSLTLSDAGDIPSLKYHFLIIPVGFMIQSIPLTPGGIGIGEWCFGQLYNMLDAEEARGIWASFTYRLISWILALVGYFIYLGMRPALRDEAALGSAAVPAAPLDVSL